MDYNKAVSDVLTGVLSGAFIDRPSYLKKTIMKVI
jgi:hypothetical protein